MELSTDEEYLVTKKAGPYFEGVSFLHFMSELNETSVVTNLVC